MNKSLIFAFYWRMHIILRPFWLIYKNFLKVEMAQKSPEIKG